MFFFLMGIFASINFTRQYHAHAKTMEEARVNAWTNGVHSNKNVFSWLGKAYTKPSFGDASELGKTHPTSTDAPASGDSLDPPAENQDPPSFDLGGNAADGSPEFGVFGFVVGEVDVFTGESTRSLTGIYKLDPAIVSRGQTTDIWARHVVCRECYIDPEPEKERGWLTVDTLGWITNSLKAIFDWLVDKLKDIANPAKWGELLGDIGSLFLPIPLDPSEWKFD